MVQLTGVTSQIPYDMYSFPSQQKQTWLLTKIKSWGADIQKRGTPTIKKIKRV